MGPDAKTKLISALNREIARRLVARWRAESGEDAIYVLARSIEWQRTHGPLPDGFFEPVEPKDPAERERFYEEQERLREFFDERVGVISVAEDIAELARRLQDRDRIIEEQRNGIVRRPRCVAGGPRSPHLLDREPAASPNGANGKSKKLTRTEQAQAKADAELQARMALVAQSQQQSGQPQGVWRLGSVQRFDSRSTSGIVRVSDYGDVSFGVGAFTNSGLVGLHPTQRVEVYIVSQPGGLVITELKAAGGDGRTLAADAEKRAEEAERNYQAMLARGRLH